jgi:hypothetical protein
MSIGDIKTFRVKPFYGGIVVGERDRNIGTAMNVEELDIFTNPDYVQPETIFTADSVIERGAWDFADDGTNIYALSDSSGGKAKIWKRANGMTSGLGSTTWAAYLTSGQNSLTDSFLECLEWDDGTKHLYYVTGTNSLYKYGNIAGSPSESSVGTLTGVSDAGGRLPTLIRQGELFIGHGKYVARVDGTGTYTNAAFTLPSGWRVVDMENVANNIAILCSPSAQSSGESAVFYWDATATTGFIDSVFIPTGNPQAIKNHTESVRVFCISGGSASAKLRIFELLGKKPFLTHELANIDIDYNTPTGAYNWSVSPRTMTIVDNVLYFGIAKTDKSGIYALGQVQDDKPLALVLARRCSTTDYSNHYPIALYSSGKDMLLAHYDGNTSSWAHQQMVYATASRSSNAVYESVVIDDSKPEVAKRWDKFTAVTSSMPASCAIVVSGRVDSTSDSYSQPQTFSTTSKTYYTSPINFNGKALQIKAAFTSNGTDAPKLYQLGVRACEEGEKSSTN